MDVSVKMLISVALMILIQFVAMDTAKTQIDSPLWMQNSISKLEDELVLKYGETQRTRLKRGLKQVSDFWCEEDGDASSFEDFVRRFFAGDQKTLDAMFLRFENLMEKLNGHMLEIRLAFREQSDLDIGPIYPFDEIFSAYNPSAHITDDFFKNKLAFSVLLNFPLTTLDQRISEGEKWTRRQWAETRLAQRFSKRIPAEVNLAIAKANAVADQYIAEYNIWMHHLTNKEGTRLFPPKMKLLSHWNLRDEIKAQYSRGEDALMNQRMIQKVMERIVDQTIPKIVINNPFVDWNPYTNEVSAASVRDSDHPQPAKMNITNEREPDTRYEVLLKTFLAQKMKDPYSPTAPTLIDRRFNENREIPEERVEAMFEQILLSPIAVKVAKLIESRLGRPLEPFDIWYNGFRSSGAYTEAELDEVVTKKYPSAEAFKNDMPNLLVKLGFKRDRADYLAENIIIDPARGSGHAWGAAMRSAKTHLRTRLREEGMDYKGFNIAIHEMGHNVEQTFSLNDIDYVLLEGVPNTAFTEALAFVFQAQDLDLLGLTKPDEKNETMKILNDFWGVYEIAGVALVDMGIWHWMYEHPETTPSELREAMIDISKIIWNRYYAPVFNIKDVTLLGIYSHIIHSFLYIPDYPMGHLIAVQVEEQMKKTGNIGTEFERMAKAGNIAPDLWMKNATGAPVGANAMLEATERALRELEIH